MSGGGKRQKVLIVGGGVAGIEAALALRDLAGATVAVDLHDPRREFVFRPFAVGEPYGSARSFRYDMEELCALCGAAFHPDGVISVDPRRRLVATRSGERLFYDHLIVASGVRMLWSVPGAITFWGAADEGQVGEALDSFRAGALERLAFTMAGGRSWALPLYELTLLAAAEAEQTSAGETRIALVTPERMPLEIFGRTVAEGTAALLDEWRVELVCGVNPIKFQDGRLRIAPGAAVEADATISLPRLEGRRIGGVPHDADGFVEVDEHCRVIGLDRVYAVGDVTTFPVKLGSIASQQADTAAEAIAAATGAVADARPFDPVLGGVLWTGREPRYLYSRPAGDRDGTSGFGERPPDSTASGKVRARYFSPLVDRLSSGGHRAPESDSAAVFRMPPPP